MMKGFVPTVMGVLLVTLPSVARGAALAPGESIPVDEISYDGPLASDVLVASRNTPFVLTGFDDDPPTTRVFNGGFTEEVYRSTVDGTLSFLYGASGSDAAGRIVDLEFMSVKGFGLTRIDDAQLTRMTGLSRSADGDTILTRFTFDTSRGLFVRTNATAFADGGEFRYQISFQPGGGEPTFESSAFRPVPEPTGAVAAVGLGAMMLFRRRGRRALQ